MSKLASISPGEGDWRANSPASRRHLAWRGRLASKLAGISPASRQIPFYGNGEAGSRAPERGALSRRNIYRYLPLTVEYTHKKDDGILKGWISCDSLSNHGSHRELQNEATEKYWLIPCSNNQPSATYDHTGPGPPKPKSSKSTNKTQIAITRTREEQTWTAQYYISYRPPLIPPLYRPSVSLILTNSSILGRADLTKLRRSFAPSSILKAGRQAVSNLSSSRTYRHR